jgi:CheY-like chemotaxis protein
VRLKTFLPDFGPVILGDETQLKQILANLVRNAGEALSGKEGEISVAITLLSLDQIRCFPMNPARWQAKDETYACLSVSDTGGGMESGTLEKVFDPCFSTKFTGRGLGLSVVLGIVEAHDGAVTAQSTPGLGTQLRVFLPIEPVQEVLSARPEPLLSRRKSGRGLVLLVEDEPTVQKMAQTMLNRLGHEVLAASDGVEALELFSRHRDDMQCVLLDLTLPRMGGWDALMALRRLDADIPVVLCSGYDKSQVMACNHAERPQAFLQKPYTRADLSAALAKIRES